MHCPEFKDFEFTVSIPDSFLSKQDRSGARQLYADGAHNHKRCKYDECDRRDNSVKNAFDQAVETIDRKIYDSHEVNARNFAGRGTPIR